MFPEIDLSGVPCCRNQLFVSGIGEDYLSQVVNGKGFDTYTAVLKQGTVSVPAGCWVAPY